MAVRHGPDLHPCSPMSRPNAKPARVPWIAWALFAVVLGGLLMLFSFIANLDKQAHRRGFKAPDDVQAARELLASKFSGPRYFQINTQAAGVPYPCIPVNNARQQVAGIVAARQMPANAAAEVEKIIAKLTQTAASRVTGMDHVNVLQLNLALDGLR